jgi:hypothetical protein
MMTVNVMSPRKKTDGDGRQLSPGQAAAAAMVAETKAPRDLFSFIDGSDRGRTLVRIHPDHHAAHAPVLPDRRTT